MSYQTYTTEAFVCGTWNRNTADCSYLLFTKEAGMLYADARSSRLEKSKQRYALQDFSYIRVSLVKGKAGWRVGSVEPIANFYLAAVDKAARGSVVQLCRSLRRFYSGEEAAPELFSYVIASLQVLVQELAARSDVEKIVQVHLLYKLGYVNQKYLPAVALEPPTTEQVLTTEEAERISKLLEQATASSQL